MNNGVTGLRWESFAVVGPWPHKPYTFRAVQRILGDTFVVCWACRRYIRLGMAGVADRDTRTTSFSCSKCGGTGDATLNDPSKDQTTADVKLDPVESPQRHPRAVRRLLSRKVEEPAPWRNAHREKQERRH